MARFMSTRPLMRMSVPALSLLSQPVKALKRLQRSVPCGQGGRGRGGAGRGRMGSRESERWAKGSCPPAVAVLRRSSVQSSRHVALRPALEQSSPAPPTWWYRPALIPAVTSLMCRCSSYTRRFLAARPPPPPPPSPAAPPSAAAAAASRACSQAGGWPGFIPTQQGNSGRPLQAGPGSFLHLSLRNLHEFPRSQNAATEQAQAPSLPLTPPATQHPTARLSAPPQPCLAALLG